ncbi:DNA/RNA non-specific endonuclease, partial [Shouchella clausii]|uniref:DNA/RNA non-specific endonuclease n=1 Tax=Shouchella clausii TaxID=79880 RepID=UPI001FE59D91
MFTDQEVAAINTYFENNPPNEERLNTNPIVAGVVDFLFGDFLTLADPEASLGEKALATTFILVKPAKVGGVIYDLSKARKVKTGGKGNGEVAKKVNYGEHYTKVDGKKVLKPNIEYRTKEGYHYKTDSSGRITNVEAKLELGKVNRNQYAQRTVGQKDRLPNDDGGHLIASIFKGSGDIDNLVPMSATLNRSEYKILENTWKKALGEGKDVTVNVKPIYEGKSSRPSEFKI